MKRALTIILLLTFTFNFLGAGFVYNVWLFSVKKNVEHKLHSKYEEEIVIIKIPKKWEQDPPADFEWHDDREFRYRGQMYDVVRKEVHNDKIWYFSYWDKAETEVLNNLSKYVSNYLQNNPDEQQKNTFLKTYLDHSFLISAMESPAVPIFEVEDSPPENMKMQNIFLDIDSPPPQKSMSFRSFT
jgi:hypothetical protein